MRPLEALRAATRPLHERLDDGAFAQAVLDGSLTLDRYASYLRAVHGVLTGLEESIEQSGSSELRSLSAHGLQRRARLGQDLAYLHTDLQGVDAAALHAVVLAQQIRLDARQSVARLLGYLYVIEGSQLGGLAQKQALARRPEFQGCLAYVTGAGPDTQAQFRAFVAKLELALSTDADVEQAALGAVHAFEGFEAIMTAVVSPELRGRWLTDPLNLEAGTHPIPRDLREVQAALHAGEQSFRAWAYYGARYGERGLRFTRSDSCWLATLVRENDAVALRHVRWLAGLLASRGMPTLLFEHHLELLHARLSAFVPERAQAYEPLRTAAQALRKERQALLDDARMRTLVDAFEPTGHALLSPREAGTLLVAAVLDEKRGHGRAVDSVAGWFADASRFTEAWRTAAVCTVDAARAAC